ncbi:MAG: polysaccharide deacetylase family protein [Armatimonadaceae bacterium]
MRLFSSPVAACAVLVSLLLLTGCDGVNLPFLSKKESTTVAVNPTPTPVPTPAPFSSTVYEPMTYLSQTERVPVIMYHDITSNAAGKSVYFDCTAAEFEEQINWLEEQGATFISLEQLHAHLVRGERIPMNSVVLTFDDNYQGFYDNAYPLIRDRRIPVAMFVHTNFVGDKAGRGKMDWDTLRELDQEGLVTIGSHTLSHPEDISKVPFEQQDRELRESKEILERELGHPVPYFAYPNGKWSQEVADAAQAAGYTMAFTIDNGPAQESPGILAINRYIHTRMKDAWEASQKAYWSAPAAVVDIPLTPRSVLLQVEEFDGIKLGIVRGGAPASWRSPSGRNSVGEFVQMARESGKLTGTIAGGMNGTFFADAALRGKSNVLIGPHLSQAEGVFFPETAEYQLPRLLNRPLVLWNKEKLMIVPFNPHTMNTEEGVREILPDATDVFLAGAWIVHNGVPRTKEEMGAYAARDFNDPRRRAFFGITDSGDVVLGGSLEVITTEMLARAAAAAGVREAVLMDSGFSTSIVFDDKIIVTGHTAKHLPSRPVPHAIVVVGEKEPPVTPELEELLAKAEPAVGEISAMEAQEQLSQRARRRRR